MSAKSEKSGNSLIPRQVGKNSRNLDEKSQISQGNFYMDSKLKKKCENVDTFLRFLILR